MLAKRIIPCLDVKNGQVVKGVRFRDHEIVGDILQLADYYSESGADELVFYDITASSDDRRVAANWITQVARQINIPFCVAGGIRTLSDAEKILNAGADKISINSPALENPEFIRQLSKTFGRQCIVIGIDSFEIDNDYWVHQYTGSESSTRQTDRKTLDWIEQVDLLGAGEIVLNCMNQDGVRQGYDLTQLQLARAKTNLPLIASGGAGSKTDFFNVFDKADVDGALAASVFHRKQIKIAELKSYLANLSIAIRK